MRSSASLAIGEPARRARRRICAAHAPSRRPRRPARACRHRPGRARRSRHSRRHAGSRGSGPGAAADARPCGRASSGRTPPAAPVRRAAARRADRPKPAGLGLAGARRQHRHRRVVAMQRRRRHDVVADRLDQRRGDPDRLADPVRQHGAVEIDAVAGINVGLPIERQVIAVLGDQHMRQQPGARPAALDRQRGHRHLHDGLAAPAGQRRPNMPDDLEPAGDVVEHLADILADLAHRAAAAGAGATGEWTISRRGRCSGKGRRRTTFALGRAGGLVSRRRHDRRGRGGGGLGLQLVDHQLELLDDAVDLLRGTAELLPAQRASWTFSFSISSVLLTRPAFAAASSRPARHRIALGDQHPPQRLRCRRAVVDRHGELTITPMRSAFASSTA